MKPFQHSRTKNILETFNSLSWFAMDAAWMLEWRNFSLILIVPSVLTGLFLCFTDRKKSLTFINVSVFSWICMNVSWMLSEMFDKESFLVVAKGFFGLGVICMIAGLSFSSDRSETFLHFKRSRLKKPFN